VFGLKTFRQYLLGRRFVIRTDHAALQWLRRTPEPMGQLARWMTLIEKLTSKSSIEQVLNMIMRMDYPEDPHPIKMT